MQVKYKVPRRLVILLAILSPGISVVQATAQVKDVVVGVTPTCPYGLSACWSGAYGALRCLDGVKSVAAAPDTYNCTARVMLKQLDPPDVLHWSEQFRDAVGEIYAFRGVELTIEGKVVQKNGELELHLPNDTPPMALAPLDHKLQWNFKKGRARQPEPDEAAAYNQLALRYAIARGEPMTVQVTGPLEHVDQGTVLEVREFFVVQP
jgi:galactose oxidase